MKGSAQGPAWLQAARELGTERSTVLQWSKRYPELFAEVRAECEKNLANVAPGLAKLFYENARLAVMEWNRRLKNPRKIKNFELTGVMDYSVKNARLLDEKSTGIEDHRHSLVERIIMIMAEERAKVNGNPRLANFQNN